MRQTRDGAAMWPLVVTPMLVFLTGVMMDVAINSAIMGGYAERFLPEICGMLVGVLTVLTFARRRMAYLGTAAVFLCTEMIVVVLPLAIEARLVLALACVITAVLCLAMYTRFAWTLLHVRMTGSD